MRCFLSVVVILSCVANGSLAGAEHWRPSEHPASLERELTTFTRPRRTLVVAAEVGGRLMTLRGEVGERIADGPVAVIDDAGARFSRDSALASLEVAVQAELAAIANAEAAKVETSFRGREVDRLVSLGESASGGQLDHARHSARVAELAELASQASRRQAASQLVVATTTRDRILDDLARYRVSAPTGWTILKRHSEEGSVISAGQPLLTVGDCRTLSLDLLVDDYELAALRSGKSIEAHFRQGGTAAAVLARVASEVESGSRRRRVELDLPGEQAPEAVGGLEVAIALSLPDPAHGVLIPLAALRTAGERPLVKLESGREIPVTVLRRRGGFAVVPASDLPAEAVVVP